MTALQAPQVDKAEDRLRMLRGRRSRRPFMAPWLIVSIVGIVGFLGLGFARTSLDRTAFELAELERAISAEESVNRDLRVELARLENPARIAPLAEEMGMVIPVETRQLLVDLDNDRYAGIQADEDNQ